MPLLVLRAVGDLFLFTDSLRFRMLQMFVGGSIFFRLGFHLVSPCFQIMLVATARSSVQANLERFEGEIPGQCIFC